MTVWRVGMLAVCVERTGIDSTTGRQCNSEVVVGEVYRVKGVKVDRLWRRNLWDRFFSKKVIRLDFGFAAWHEARCFRPAVHDESEDDAELIARIKACRRIPTAAPTPTRVRGESEPTALARLGCSREGG